MAQDDVLDAALRVRLDVVEVEALGLELAHAALVAAIGFLAPLLRWLPLTTHLQLLIVLWLQLPYFRHSTIALRRLLKRAPPPGADADATPDGGARAARSNALYSARLLRRGGGERTSPPS